MRLVPRAAASAIALALVVAGCGTSPTESPAGTRPLIVDLDMDSSDVMALAYALNLPGYEVVAVTVPGTGVGRCPLAAANALRVIREVGVGDIPVGCGSVRAVGGGHPFPDAWRDPSDALYGVRLATSDTPPSAPDADDLLVTTLHAANKPVDILALGPLTNIARMLLAEPSMADRIHRVVTMAGAFDVPGNVDDPTTGSPEWNVWADPGAMAAVIKSGVAVVMVPLDATNDVPLDGAFYGSLASGHGAAAANIAYELLSRNTFLLGGGQFLWDPLAAAYLEEPEVVETEAADVLVGTEGAEQGRTIQAAGGTRVTVAHGARRGPFELAFLAGLRRGSARTAPFAPRGPINVAYDGTSCTATGTHDLVAGPVWVSLTSSADLSAVAVLVTLHPDATWDELEAFLSTFDPAGEPPGFADIGPAVFPTIGYATITDPPAGMTGVACVEVDAAGTAQRVTMSAPFEVTP